MTQLGVLGVHPYHRMTHSIKTRRAVSSAAIARIRMMGPKSRLSSVGSSVGGGSAVVAGSWVAEGGSVPRECVCESVQRTGI